MPVFLAALLGGLLSVCSSFVGRALVALGISYVTYTGLSVVTAWIVSQFHSAVTGAPLAAVQVMGLLQVDTCFSILMSAIAARLVIRGVTSGALTKMVVH